MPRDALVLPSLNSIREKDPHGLDQHDPGAKLDDGKIMVSLLADFGLALTEVAKVCTYGAKKYSRGGWQHVPDGINRYNDAKWRHLLELRYNEIDEDSGLLHEAQEIWNSLAKLELKLRKKKLKNEEVSCGGDYSEKNI